MKNEKLAEIFRDIADILEIQNENPFRIRAYRRASRNIENTRDDIETVVREGRINEIPGIGKDLAQKIEEYVTTGRMRFYDRLKKQVGRPVLELLTIPGIGPKTAKVLCETLKIKGISDLEKKLARGTIREIPGMRDKTLENIRRGIVFLKRSEERISLAAAVRIADGIITQLEKCSDVQRIVPAGSLRRMKETVRDIDILIISRNPEKVMRSFVTLPEVKEVISHGPKKSSVRTHENVQVDVRVIERSSFGSALCYFTGSKEHNVTLRKMAVRKALKINEYGVFTTKTHRKIAGKEEEEIYRALGLDYIPPELREDRGEIKAAQKKELPELVALQDVKGDLHVHSKSSDGLLSFEEIASACQARGYEYAVVTDHSKSLRVARGLGDKELLRNAERVRKLNRKLKKFRLLIGSEVDILADGRLDYGDEVLRELDFVIAALHSGFKQPRNVLTDRIIRAMENRYIHMIAHPTGRLIGSREAYEIDLDKILAAAKATNTALEINALPERLDLDDTASRRAKEAGVMLGIGTDTHPGNQFKNMMFGVSVARRGWLEKKDILNTLHLKSLLNRIQK